MESKTKKKIIIITVIFLFLLVGGTIIVTKVLNTAKGPVVEKQDSTIKDAPAHHMFYFEESTIDDSSLNVYDELGNQIDKVKVDLIMQEVNKNEEGVVATQKGILSKPTKIEKINNRLYALIDGEIYNLARTLAPQKVVAKEQVDGKEIKDFTTIGLRNELMVYTSDDKAIYVNLTDKNTTILNKYNEDESEALNLERNEVAYKEVLKFKADKDGIYILTKDLEKDIRIERFLITPEVRLTNKKVIITEEIKDFTKVEDWIYYVTKDNDLYRVFKDGTQKSKVAENIKNASKDTYNAGSYICGYIDTVFYIDDKGNLNRSVVKTKDQMTIAENVESIVYEYGFVYYTTKSSELYCVNASTEEIIKLRDEIPENILILDQNLPN